MPTIAYIGVGSNLGNRLRGIEQAHELIAGHPKIRMLQSAPIYETEPERRLAQPNYLNTVWKIETEIEPHDLLQFLLETELRLGRVRKEKNGPRTIDLDLLFYGDRVIDRDGLKVPHPRAHRRWFVLKPLAALDPCLVHPVIGKRVDTLLMQLEPVHENLNRSRKA